MTPSTESKAAQLVRKLFEDEYSTTQMQIFVEDALRSERERVIEDCAEIVKKWHYKKGGYTVLEEEILKLKGSK